MSIFDDDNPFGGMFDINDDGRESFGEQLIGLSVFGDYYDEDERREWAGDCMDLPLPYDDDDEDFEIRDSDFDDDDNQVAAVPAESSTEEEPFAWLDDNDNDPVDIDGIDDIDDIGYVDPDQIIEELRAEAEIAEWENQLEREAELEEAYTQAYEDAKNDLLTELEGGYGGRSALAVARASFRKKAEKTEETEDAAETEDEIKEENYENRRRFLAATFLAEDAEWYRDSADGIRKIERCEFIRDHADDTTAAAYLTPEGKFLYALAVRDNFELPVSLPDEDEEREYEIEEALSKIAKRDVTLCFEVWEWCLATFLPYAGYAEKCVHELTTEILDRSHIFHEGYKVDFVRYAYAHPDFMNTVLNEKQKAPIWLYECINEALREGLYDEALAVFSAGIRQGKKDWKYINNLTDRVVRECESSDDYELAEYLMAEMMPVVKEVNLGMVQDEIEEWEDRIRKIINVKYEWREDYDSAECFGLNPADFETEAEFREAYERRFDEECRKKCEQAEAQRRQQTEQQHRQLDYHRRQEQEYRFEQQLESEKGLSDDEVYTFCGVALPYAIRLYHYRTDDPSIKVGDMVRVPAGNNEVVAKVVSVGQYLRIAAPYPVEKTKFVIGKADKYD